MFCIQCGEQLPDPANYCPACGTSRSGEPRTPAREQWDYSRLQYRHFAKWDWDMFGRNRITVETLKSGYPFWELIHELGGNGWEMCGSNEDPSALWFKRRRIQK